MKLVAVTFITPIRFHGDRIDIARVDAGFTFDPPSSGCIGIHNGLKAAVVPTANCVFEYEDEPEVPPVGDAPKPKGRR